MSKDNLTVIAKETALKLDQRKKNIGIFIAGVRKGAAEHFGYSFLAGREMLLAKESVAHGNSDANGGFKKWIESNFPELPYRTAVSWMRFSESVTLAGALQPRKNAPLLLTNGKITERDHEVILKAVPQVMDGKTMTEFMRDTRLLRDPQKPKHTPRKATNGNSVEAKQKQASRLWISIASDHELGRKVLRHLNDDQVQGIIDECVDTANAARELLKQRKGGK